MSNTQRLLTPIKNIGHVITDANEKHIATASNLKYAESIVACINEHDLVFDYTRSVVARADENDLVFKELQKTKAYLMDAYSLIGQYRGQRDALMRAASEADILLSRKAIIDAATPQKQKTVSQQLREAIATVKRHDHSKDPMMEALEQIVKDSAELPHIHEIARKALEKGGAL